MNNIPQFLEHLPIWKVNSLDKVKPKNVKPVKAHQYDVADRIPNHFVEKICPVCGTSYKVEYRLRNINKTCSGSCGQEWQEKNLIHGLRTLSSCENKALN